MRYWEGPFSPPPKSQLLAASAFAHAPSFTQRRATAFIAPRSRLISRNENIDDCRPRALAAVGVKARRYFMLLLSGRLFWPGLRFRRAMKQFIEDFSARHQTTLLILRILHENTRAGDIRLYADIDGHGR